MNNLLIAIILLYQSPKELFARDLNKSEELFEVELLGEELLEFELLDP